MEEQKVLTIVVGEPLTKKQEADILCALWRGKGYFADEFTEEETDTMIANIEGDMPLISGTRIECDLANAKKSALELETKWKGSREEIAELEDQIAELKEQIARKEAEEITMQREADAMKAKISAWEIEWEVKNREEKRISADYEQLTADYERKCELLDVAVASIGRLTLKL